MLSKLLIAWRLMALCVEIHAMGLIAAFRWMKMRTANIERRFWLATWRLIRVAGWTLLLHLLQISAWAFVYAWRGAMPNLASAFYFSMVTYTTTGYGDLVLSGEWRILGGVQALTGILMCGLSTGMFFAVFSKIYRLQSATLLLGTIVSGWLATALFAAEPAGVSAEEQEITEELKEITDPTILKRRIWLETEWNKYTDGYNTVEETLGGLWAWPVSSNQDWAVRLKVPYEWHIAGDTSRDSNNQGLGDIKAATGTAFRLSGSWRAGGGLEMRMPTAAHNDLGDNNWRLQEFGAVAWDVTRWLTFSPSAEYNETLAQVHGASANHYLELFFPATILLPSRCSVTARYEAKVDFENDNYVTHSAKLLLAKELENVPLSLALSIKKSFDSGEKEFQVNFIVSWFFR